jgi:hypothetical protein
MSKVEEAFARCKIDYIKTQAAEREAAVAYRARMTAAQRIQFEKELEKMGVAPQAKVQQIPASERPSHYRYEGLRRTEPGRAALEAASPASPGDAEDVEILIRRSR